MKERNHISPDGKIPDMLGNLPDTLILASKMYADGHHTVTPRVCAPSIVPSTGPCFVLLPDTVLMINMLIIKLPWK
jgi:hypothetical protein